MLVNQLEVVSIVIDAVEESSDEEQVCVFLEAVCLLNMPNIRIIVSSNSSQTRKTEATLRRLFSQKEDLKAGLVNKDIEAHLKMVDLSQWDDELKERIMKHIIEHSGGS